MRIQRLKTGGRARADAPSPIDLVLCVPAQLAGQELLWVQPPALLADAEVAVFRPRWSGGGSEWVWQEKDQPLIRFKGRHGELPLLVLLGWYLILLYAEDAAAASSVATVAVTTTT